MPATKPSSANSEKVRDVPLFAGVPDALPDLPEPDAPKDLSAYDRFIVAFSGGKDSLASLLSLLEAGADPRKIELWHHSIDGSARYDEGQRGHESELRMDWPCTEGYCEAVAAELGIPIYFSWRAGGFAGEISREEDFTNGVFFEVPASEYDPETDRKIKGDRGLRFRPSQRQERFRNTRGQFPQVSADLSVRWCSAYLKIDVGEAALRGQDRFRVKPAHDGEDAKPPSVLFVTGERGEESAARAGYEDFEPHGADLREGTITRRYIDHWRPIKTWKEGRVWEIIERHRMRPHPAYEIGFGRVSCMTCIFGSANQYATIKAVAPSRFETLAQAEEETGKTIKRNRSVRELAAAGTPYRAALENPPLARLGLTAGYEEPVRLPEGAWAMPAGAFGESAGPS